MHYSMNYDKFLRAVLTWLDLHYCKSGFFHVGVRVLNKYLTILHTRGKPGAIKFCKDSRLILYRWLSAGGHLSCLSNSAQERVKLPNYLSCLKHIVKRDQDYPIIRLVLTALYASRELKTPVRANIASIIALPSYDKGRILDMSNYVDSFWRAIGSRSESRGSIPKAVRWTSFHLSTKTGPSGLQSLWSAYADARCLPDELVEAITVVGGKELAQKMCSLRDLVDNNPLGSFISHYYEKKPVVGRFRKISPIQSQEGKTREVAILDYWSQSALRGLHQWLFRWLRRIPQDCTFDQGSFVQKIPSNKEPFYSIDLTAATDRFPIDLIEIVLAGRLPKPFVTMWRRIMVGFPFQLPDKSMISYSAGNPMGAYSSWNSFALSHHFVMYYCCKLLKMNWSEAPYVILGDDVLIRHKCLAECYMDVVRSLGLEISVSKTHSSKHFREFAKRVFYDDRELTPFPISALWTTRNSQSLTLGVVVSECAKGWSTEERTPEVLLDLYRLMRLPLSVRRRRGRILDIAYDLLISLQGRVDAATALRPSLEKHYPSLLGVEPDFNMILRSVVMTAFARSAKPQKGRALGDLVVDAVCILTDPSFDSSFFRGLNNTSWTSFDLIYSTPFLQVHGLIEEKWLEIRRGVFDSLSSGDWKLTLRALTIPMTDSIYYSQNADVKPNASFSLAKILDEHLKCVVEGKWSGDIDKELISSIAKTFGGIPPDGSVIRL